MNCDSAAYGASRELYSGDDKYGCGFPVNGMELQMNWEYLQSGGRLGQKENKGHYQDLVPIKEFQAVQEKINRCGMSRKAIGRAIKLSPQGIDAIANGQRPYENNRTFKALKAYFGLEG